MADITSNLVVYYTFNNGYLNFANGYPGVADTSNNGTTINTTTYRIGNGSLQSVAASNQYLTMNNITTQPGFFTLPGSGITLSFWLNYGGGQTGSNTPILYVGKTDYNNAWQILLSGQINVVAWVSYNTNTTQRSFGIGDYRNTGWNHFVWTMTYVAQTTGGSTWKLYVNGTLTATVGNQNYPQNIDTSILCSSNYGGGNFTGYLDDFRIYQRVLAQADVTALYNYTGGDPPTPPCFREGTQILCFHDGKEQYLPVEKMRTGTLVKTLLDDYVPVALIGRKILNNPEHQERIENRLYRCSKDNYPELSEDLYITGHHSILVDQLTEEQEKKTLEIMKNIYITDAKYRLLACVDERTEPFTKAGEYMIYHFALENDNITYNSGVYANGLLVESCSREYMEVYSGMDII
jgi:hypothetical protein